MVDVIVNQRLLRLIDRFLDGMELLRQVKTGTAVREHLDHLVKVTFGTLEALDDSGMRSVNMIIHGHDHIPLRGICQGLVWNRWVGYMVTMSHTVRQKKKLLARVRRIKGQVEAIERALGEEAECERIMHMIAGIRGSVAGLMAEVVEDHIRTHLVDPQKNPGALNADAADQLIEVVHSYLK